MTPTALYPLRFREILRHYSFGGHWIREAFPAKEGLPEDQAVAETWEVCDREGESSVVRNGVHAGRSLHDLIEEYGGRLLGSAIMEKYGGRFPLLVKLLDASSVLGEQAHHSDALAAARGLRDPGKTEAWYMLRTRDDSRIRCGNRDGVTEEDLRQSLYDGTSAQLMQEHAVSPGDAFLLYAGTMHYSGGGQLFYEIMENSDVYIGLGQVAEGLSDEERRTRVEETVEGVHLEEGFDCRTSPISLDEPWGVRTVILACEHFALERMDLRGTCMLAGSPERFAVLTVIDGNLSVTSSGTEECLGAGNTVLVPAACRDLTLVPSGDCSVLRAWVPDLKRDIVDELRGRGIDDAGIAGLGGRTGLSDVGGQSEQ